MPLLDGMLIALAPESFDCLGELRTRRECELVAVELTAIEPLEIGRDL